MVKGEERLKKLKERTTKANKIQAQTDRRLATKGGTAKVMEIIDAKRAASHERTWKCRENKEGFPSLEYNQIKAIPPPGREKVGLRLLREMDAYST